MSEPLTQEERAALIVAWRADQVVHAHYQAHTATGAEMERALAALNALRPSEPVLLATLADADAQIADLEGQIARLEHDADGQQAQATRMGARIAALEAALQPVAAFSLETYWPEGYKDDWEIVMAGDGSEITAGHVRHARALLAERWWETS
jgi:septal ring factor EnvC (AmiA/AmiB activator)